VGVYDATGVGRSLILHYDGTTWHQIRHSHQGGADNLTSVKAVSATDVWAVGFYLPSLDGPMRTWILHYDGTSWSIESSPNRGSSDDWLNGVASNSSKNAFAVGIYHSSGTRGLVMHCAC
jgi:hypothetical protein